MVSTTRLAVKIFSLVIAIVLFIILLMIRAVASRVLAMVPTS